MAPLRRKFLSMQDTVLLTAAYIYIFFIKDKHQIILLLEKYPCCLSKRRRQ